MLCTVAANGLWPQARLHSIGAVGSDKCVLCPHDVGTQQHRAWQCVGTRAFRDQYGLPRSAGVDQRQKFLWEFGLMTDPTVWLPRPASICTITWDVAPADGLFHGEAYGDGSTYNGNSAATARSGWAVTQVEESNGVMVVIAAARGALPGLYQGTPPAEAFSLLQYLTHAGLPPHAFATDCDWVRRSWAAGRICTTSSGKIHANLWRQIFDKAELLGGAECVTVRKVKAHTARIDISRGVISEKDRAGNASADRFAKLGANDHPQDAVAFARHEKAVSVTQLVAKYLARMSLHVAHKHWDDTAPKSERRRRSVASTERRKRRRQATDHLPMWQGGRWRCARCLRTGAKIDTVLAHKCQPGKRHRLLVTGQHVFCGRCGSHSTKRARNLLAACKGGRTAAGRLALECLHSGVAPGSSKRQRQFRKLPRPVPVGAEWFDMLLAAAAEEGEDAQTLHDAQTSSLAVAAPRQDAQTLLLEAATPLHDAQTSSHAVAAPLQNAQTPLLDVAAPRQNAQTPSLEVAAPLRNAQTPPFAAEAGASERGLSRSELGPREEKQLSCSKAGPAATPAAGLKDLSAPLAPAACPAACEGVQTSLLEAAAPMHDAPTPSLEVAAPLQDGPTPLLEAATPLQEAQTSSHEAAAPLHDAQTSSLEVAAPLQDAQTSLLEVAAPMQDARTPLLEAEAGASAWGISRSEGGVREEKQNSSSISPFSQSLSRSLSLLRPLHQLLVSML
jgi:hypothetical protein